MRRQLFSQFRKFVLIRSTVLKSFHDKNHKKFFKKYFGTFPLSLLFSTEDRVSTRAHQVGAHHKMRNNKNIILLFWFRILGTFKATLINILFLVNFSVFWHFQPLIDQKSESLDVRTASSLLRTGIQRLNPVRLPQGWPRHKNLRWQNIYYLVTLIL